MDNEYIRDGTIRDQVSGDQLCKESELRRNFQYLNVKLWPWEQILRERFLPSFPSNPWTTQLAQMGSWQDLHSNEWHISMDQLSSLWTTHTLFSLEWKNGVSIMHHINQLILVTKHSWVQFQLDFYHLLPNEKLSISWTVIGNTCSC